MNKHLNSIFGNEENFSNYIKDEKLDEISKIIGKTLKKDSCETEVKAQYDDHDGTLRADLRIQTDDGKYVVIENQYFNSNHDHLGKILTYSTMFWEDKRPVTDAVWIMEKVREEHYNAVEFINELLKEKNVDFKIWIVIASGQDKRSIKLNKKIEKNDFFVRGENKTKDPQYKEELSVFMPQLKEGISNVLPDGWDIPKIFQATPHCIEVVSREKPYKLNVPFRVKNKKIKVEANFNSSTVNKDFYKIQVEENGEDIINLYPEEKSSYNIRIHDALSKISYGKIFGEFQANIENQTNWSYYIEQALDLLTTIIEIANQIETY